MEIVVGAGESLIQWLMLPTLAEMQRQIPNTRFKFLNLTGEEIIRRLHDGLIDFGVTRKETINRPLKSSALGEMEFSIFVPVHREHARRKTDLASLLEDTPLAVLEGDGVFRQQLAEVARTKSLILRIAVECSSFTLVAQALASGRVGGVLPTIAKSELRIKEGGFLARPIPSLKREISLAWNPRQFGIRPALENACRVLQAIICDRLRVDF
jgi:DNA-binding transcriptional LysR family regulator